MIMGKPGSSDLTNLNNVIDKVVETCNVQVDSLDKTSVEEAVKNSIREAIINEVCEYKKTQIIQEAKVQIEEEKKKNSFASIKQIMWEGFVLALIVGLLVNEASYMIEYLKNLGDASVQIVITVILIIVFAIAALALYIIKFTKDIIDKFVKNKRK